MLYRKFLFAAALAMTLGGIAHADNDKENKDGYSERSHSQFFRCLRTDKIRFHGTIVEAALATSELSTLAFAVQAAGLVDVLSGPGPFTVYAPTDSAFAAIPDPVLSAILADTGLLSAVLTYHVSPGIGRWYDPRRTFYRPNERRTVQGQTVFYNRSEDGPQVNQSNVNCQAVRTDNGVVWLIDSVLLPQF